MNPDNKRLKELKEERYLPGPEIFNLYRIEGTFQTESPLHVGSGEFGPYPHGRSDAKNTSYVLLEDPGRAQDGTPMGFPYIPASSLKGVLRAWCEGILSPWNSAVGLIAAPPGEGIASEDLVKANREARNSFKDPEDDEGREAAGLEAMAQHQRSNLDLVGGLFGATRWRSKVEVENARIGKKDLGEAPRTLLRALPGVAIDRDLGVAEDQKLYQTEVVREGAVFIVVIRAVNVRHWELGLLFSALESFNHPHFPTALGAHTHKGLGRMKWSLSSVAQIGDDEKKASKKSNPLKVWAAVFQGISQQPTWTGQRAGEQATRWMNVLQTKLDAISEEK